MNHEQLDSLTQDLIEMLEKMDEGEENGFEMPFITLGFGAENLVSKKQYTGFNLVKLSLTSYLKGYRSNVWATYKQWQEKGCQVKKGEKSTTIIWCKPVKYEVETTNSETGDVEIMENVVNVAKVYFVFNACQVEGFKEDVKELEGTPKENALQFFANCGIKQEEYVGRAFYQPSTDTVYVPPYKDFKSEAEYVATLAHEYCHATGAKNRLNRDFKNRFGDEGYAFEELVAEIGAGMVAGYLGYEYQFGKNNLAYLKSWLKVLKNDRQAIIRACSHAQKAFDYLVKCQEVSDEV